MMLRRFGVALLLCWSTADASPEWVAHASRPGPDHPPAGQSRFDELFRQADGRYRIPYPFSALRAALERRVDNGSEAGVRRVLIPRGRSLQRDAPAPRFDRYPREIIALEGEPAPRGSGAGNVLEYRLFVAHQPATRTLELISYNDELGRFEFQVVTGYRADSEVRVEMANRALCLSCHQNAGPIFPRRPWSETPFNVAVARSLAQHYPPAGGSLIGLVTTDAGLIDVLSERANYLAAAQTVWQRGCASARCRAAALRAVLQYRLSGETGFDTGRLEFRRDYVAELRQNWGRRWPQGLALADSRIDDRDPFADEPAVALDPLTLRSPHAVWREADPVLAHGILRRLAGFFSNDDILRLDRRLRELNPDRAGHRLEAICRVRDPRARPAALDCGGGDPKSLQAGFEISFDDGRPTAVRLLAMRFPNDPALWQPQAIRLQPTATGIAVELRQADSPLSPRLGNGDRLATLQFDWTGNFEHVPVSLRLELRDEFEPLDRALERMLRANLEGRSDSLSGLPFRRDAILTDLMKGLDMPPPRWPARPRRAMPDASTEAPPMLTGDLALLYPYCGHCHADPGPHPPGFLAPADTIARVRACAPRIWRRLDAWRHIDSVPGAPMPPPATLALSGSNHRDWPHSEHYDRLLRAVENLLARQAADRPWKSATYASLPACSGEP